MILIVFKNHLIIVKRLKKTFYEVIKTTIFTFCQQLNLDSSPLFFDVPITAAPMISTTIAQEKAQICLETIRYTFIMPMLNQWYNLLYVL
jgi:hypothetical protein